MRAVICVFAIMIAACAYHGPVDPGDDGTVGDDAPPPPPARYASCAAALAAGQTASGVYHIDPLGNGAVFDAYCNMTVAGGGWTLAIKADGSQPTFAFDDPQWTTAAALNPASPGHDRTEAKLDSYARLAANSVLIESDDGFLVLALNRGLPLLDMIAPGSEQPLPMGPSAWANVVPSSSAPTCSHDDGINLSRSGYAARIGVVARDWGEEGCSEESRITIGIGLAFSDSCNYGPTDATSVGHVYSGCTIADAYTYVYVR